MTAPAGRARLSRRAVAPARGTGEETAGQGRAWAARIAAGLAILVIWQVGATAAAPAYIARPLRTLEAVPAVLASPQFWSATGSTLLAVIEGLVIAVLIGTAAGLVMGRLRDIDRALRLYVNSFYAMPLVALVPLLTVWFGYTPTARLVVTVLEASLPVAFSVAEGGRHIPAAYTDVARVYRAPWWRVWAGVALPACVPYLLGGIDLAIGRALIGAVVTEFIAGLNGLGFYILFHVRSFQEDKAMVAVAVLVAFALAARALVSLTVRRGLPWYQEA